MTSDYTRQTWHDDDPATPVSAARLGHIEDGIHNHGHPDIEAEIAAGGGGGGGGAAPTTAKALLVQNPTTMAVLLATKDGKVWDRIGGPWPGTTQTLGWILAHNGTRWLMGNQSMSGTTALATSDDGYLWVPVDSPFGMSDGSVTLLSITAVGWDATNGVWMVVANDTSSGAYLFSTSADLVTWSTPVDIGAQLIGGSSLEIESIAEHGGVIIAGTTNPQGYTNSVGDYKSLFMSTDGGATWTDPGLGLDGDGNVIENTISSTWGAFWVHDRWFALTDNGLGPGLWVSTDDGATWVEQVVTGGPALAYNSVAYGNGRFLAVSSQGNYVTAMIESVDDGATWHAVGERLLFAGNGSYPALHSIVYAGDRFLAWGIGGIGMAESLDGDAWSPVLIPFDGTNINLVLRLLVAAA